MRRCQLEAGNRLAAAFSQTKTDKKKTAGRFVSVGQLRANCYHARVGRGSRFSDATSSGGASPGRRFPTRVPTTPPLRDITRRMGTHRSGADAHAAAAAPGGPVPGANYAPMDAKPLFGAGRGHGLPEGQYTQSWT